MKNSLFSRYAVAVFTAVTALLPLKSLQAQALWTGGGTNNNWSIPTNWSDSLPPVDGDGIIFTGSTRLVNTNDLNLANNAWVRFESDGFTLNGNPLFLTQGITNLVGTNTIAMNLNWGSIVGQNVFVAPGSELVIAGIMTNTLVNHTNTGGGRVRVTGAYLQTNNPPATVLNNVEYIVDGGSFTSGGGVRITSGTTPSASKLVLTNGATMNQTVTGGTIRVGDIAGIVGELIIDNSTLIHNGGNVAIGFSTNTIGAVKQNGGVVTNADIQFCAGATSIATYDMVGGTLAPIRIRKTQATGTASITFDGSLLRPGTNVNTAFFTGLDTAEIKSGGLTVDNSGVAFTIGQSFSGVGRLTKTGSGTLTITGSSTNDGLTANQGTVVLNSVSTFTNVLLTGGTLQIQNDAAVGGPLALNGGTIRGNNATARTIGAPVTLGGNVTFANNDLTFTGDVSLTGNRTLTVNNTNTFSGIISESGGSFSITKAGTGVLQLSVNNSYSGDTLVNNGTLRVTNPTGSATGSGTVIASGTGTVSGNGRIGAISLNSGGSVAPATGVGILVVTNAATFGTAGVYHVEMTDAATNLAPGVGVDFLNIQGALNIPATSGSPFVINLSSMGGMAANFNNAQTSSWIIATAAGGITGFSANKFVVSTTNFLNNLGANTFSISTNGNNLLLNFGAAVTPPSTINSNIAGAGTTNAVISFSTVSGANYTVQYKTNLNQIGWIDLTNFTASGSTSIATDNANPVPAERYYRIVTP